MKKAFLLVVAIVLAISGFSQNFRNNKKEVEKVRNSDEYYYANSDVCTNLHKAEISGISNLVDAIYRNCDPQMVFFDDGNDTEMQSKRVFETFTSSIKQKSKHLVLSSENGHFEVFCYIKKSDFQDICDERKERADYYCKEGLKVDSNEKENSSIGDALRYYYWSLILCYSHPYGLQLTYKLPEGDTVMMKDWLYERIYNLLNEIKFIPNRNPVMKSRASVVYELNVTDGSDKIPWLKFQYNDGNSLVENSVDSGVTSIELFDSNIDKVEILISLENKNEAEARAREVFAIMQKLDEQVFFEPAIKNVKIKKVNDGIKPILYQDSVIVEMQRVAENLVNDKSISATSDYEKIMKQIEKALRTRDIMPVKKHFTEDGFEMLNNLFSNEGSYYIIGSPEYKFLEFGDRVICRCIPMQFKFKDNVGFIRNVVFRFDKNSQKVESIAFRLTDIAEMDILGKDSWEPDSRMILINFLEDYQTAYALKRHDYLSKIFSDDALIVVGTVLKQKRKGDDWKVSPEVQYDTLSKGLYMDKLSRIFANNEFVNIRFMDTEFTKHKAGIEVYGIQVKQEYLSSRYGDVGYLFLMVDLRENLPVIHVRTWEPEKTQKPISFDQIMVEL